jgi:hypothetical protein
VLIAIGVAANRLIEQIVYEVGCKLWMKKFGGKIE